MKNDVKCFENYLEEMRLIVEKMEKEELSLDESMQLFEEGTKLYRKANVILEQAKSQVDVLLQDGTLEALKDLETEEIIEEEEDAQ